MSKEPILVVDDEDTIRFVLCSLMTELGCEAVSAGSAEEALAEIRERKFAVALLDIMLPGMSGIQLLGRIKEISPDTEVLMMTSHASVDTAIEALRCGAYNYFHKPFDIDDVSAAVSRALEKRRLMVRNRELLEAFEHKNVELSAAVGRLESLYRVGVKMSAVATIAELLDFLVDVVTVEMGVDRASIMTLSEDGRELTIAACRGIDDSVKASARVPVGEGVAGRVALTGQAILVRDVHAPGAVETSPRPSLGDSFLSAPIVLSVPILGPQRTIGVINVTNRTDGRPFDEGDLAFLSGLSAQAAITIERARKSEELFFTIENLRATQDELVASERIAALGKLAAGVAHDFNNILNGILGRAQMILSTDPAIVDPALLRRNLERIEVLARQGGEVVRRIQEFSRIRNDRPDEIVDLNDIVRRTMDLTRPTWCDEPLSRGKSILVKIEAGKVPPVAGNTSELCQAVSNLVFNSIEAMPEGGKLSVRTWTEDERACLSVEDTGVGMSEETRARLFEPFYTTKEAGHGLGMSVVFGIIKRFGGSIDVHSQPGQGARLVLRLPAAPTAVTEAPAVAVESTAATADASAPQRRPRPPLVPGEPIRVLVVDDEEYNRELYQDILASHGMVAEGARNGEEGVSLFRHGNFDVVLTDLTMPGISGWHVARSVKAHSPGTPVIVLSGWAVQENDSQMADAGVDLVLSKPVSVDDLGRSIFEACARARQGGASRPDAGDPPLRQAA